MIYDELIEILKQQNLRKILLFGPPRSGSTITSYILCNELDASLIPEDVATRFRSSGTYMKALLRNNNVVVHANNAVLYMDGIADPNIAKVIMNRRKHDILHSAVKVNIFDACGYDYWGLDKKAPDWVEAYYNHCNKHLDNNTFFLDYDSLKTTKYWIPKKERLDFSIKQVTQDHDAILKEFGEDYLRRHKKYLDVGKE